MPSQRSQLLSFYFSEQRQLLESGFYLSRKARPGQGSQEEGLIIFKLLVGNRFHFMILEFQPHVVVCPIHHSYLIHSIIFLLKYFQRFSFMYCKSNLFVPLGSYSPDTHS